MESDLINLDKLKSIYGDESTREIVEMSLKEGRGLLTALKKSVPARDAAAVAYDAHQLKGMSATVTMARVADLSYKLETCAKNQTWQDCDQLLDTIEACFSELESIINAS